MKNKLNKIIIWVLGVFLLMFCINTLKYIYTSATYGTFSLIAKYPKYFFIDLFYFEPKMVKIDENTLLFAIAEKRGHALYKFDLNKKKFTKLNTVIKEHDLKYIEKIDGRIYFIFRTYKDFFMDTFDRIVVYNYEKDYIENTYDEKYISSPFKIVINNKESLAYAEYKGDTPDEYPEYGICIFDGEKIKSEPRIKLVSGRWQIVGQSSDEKLIIYDEIFDDNKRAYYREYTSFDLKTGKKISKIIPDKITQKTKIIWLGENKFLVVSTRYKEKTYSALDTFEVKKDGTIEKIATKEVEFQGRFFNLIQTTLFSAHSYVVLNPRTVIFSSGLTEPIEYGKIQKTTYLFDYKTNEFKRITDFYYKTAQINFLRLDDSSFLVYDTKLSDSCIFVNAIYRFKLRRRN